MKSLIKWFLILAVVSGVCIGGYIPLSMYFALVNKPRFRTAEVEKGTIVSNVNSTGTVKPTISLQVGSFVSGPLDELFVEFNQEVEKDEVLAKIDPRLFQANVDSSKATYSTRVAEVARVTAQLQQAKNDENRALALYKDDPEFISQSELDQFKFGRMALEAQLDLAKATVEQANANLKNSQQNLDYCTIKAPESGIVIDRKVEPGQTLAAQFQTPELFVIGVNMREKMHIFADVVESDIGLIRKAKEEKRPVKFTVDAYPDDLFEGIIEEVRYNSTETQSVVTYPVVVGAPNPELKLLPGMTANLSFQLEEKVDVIKIPNAALRYYPDKVHVHESDHPILEGKAIASDVNEEEAAEEADNASASQRSEAKAKSRVRHVWYLDGEKLRAIEVKTGISDNKYTELLSGELIEGKQLVTGLKAKGEK